MPDTFNFSLRMPPEIGETIYEMSKNDRRPMNTTIVMLLEAAIREKNRKKKKIQSPIKNHGISKESTG